jgi:hypothetical protein
MKKQLIHLIYVSLCATTGLIFNSCTEFLEQEPISTITAENYFSDDAQVSSYVINCYGFLPTPGRGEQSIAGRDDVTDNQGSIYPKVTKFADNQYKVPQRDGDWNFNDIYRCNYFFKVVLPKWQAGEISGNQANLRHYIGEMYFLRAFVYFKHLQLVGDFPIVKTTLPDNPDELILASRRAPRNEVARFILADLDSAKALLQTVAPDGKKNRISKVCAQLFSSRVALFEATWEKYFKGTAFVPNGPGWLGKDKDYNANYQFPSGSIDGEITFFLNKAMEDAEAVAEAVPNLTANTFKLQQDPSEPINPYYDMFAQTDMSIYPEVLLWRKYDNGLDITNGNNEELQNGRINATRGLVDCFLMQNGLPIYDSNSGYHGDDSIPLVRKDRDNRLFLFLKQPGQKNVLYPFASAKTSTVPTELISPIVTLTGRAKNSATGYDLRKGLNFDASTCLDNSHNTTGTMIFRAVEAYLNYIEACYEKNGSLDANADKYWKAIRARAGVDPDYNRTIAATDMSKEALNDWGAYSGGNLVNTILYNIRRERRCELMAEGMRNNDILRWRSMDQMITTPYHIEGFKLWGPIQYMYPSSALRYNRGNSSTVSSPDASLYLRPYEILPSSTVFNGYIWKMAHYLSPIAVQHFLLTSKDGTDISTSTIYQNPGWPVKANEVAEQ